MTEKMSNERAAEVLAYWRDIIDQMPSGMSDNASAFDHALALLRAQPANGGEAVATVHSDTTPGDYCIVTPGFPRGTKLYAHPAPSAPAGDGFPEYVIALLIAAGYVTQAKVDEARRIALGINPPPLAPATPPQPAVDGVADFEIHAGGSFFASVGGPRQDAWREALNYVATLHPDDGEPEVFEVTRTRIPLYSALVAKESGHD